MDFETIWYEYVPYLYAIAGIVVIEEIGSTLGTCLGLVMLAGVARTLVLRWSHRLVHGRKSSVKTD